MSIRAILRCVVPALACLAMPVEGQKLIVLPGASSSAATASAFATNPLSSAGTINAAPGAFLAFSNPVSSRFFIVTTSGVVVTDSSGAQVQTPLAIANVNGAALSSDSSTLVVVSGTSSSGEVSIFDVSGETASLAASLTVGNNPLDVAISLDSATAYVVNAGGITPVDLTANTVGTPVALAGLTPSGSAKPGVTVGPNGLVYVNASRVVYELHPATLATLNTISVAGFPGKPSFSSDATAAAIPNQTAGSPYVSVLNLTNHTISGDLSTSGYGSVSVNRVYYGSQYIYFTSPTTSHLYEFLPSSPVPSLKPLLGNVISTAASNEPAGPNYLFTVGQNPSQVTRLDISPAATAPVTAPLGTTAGPAFYVSPENTDTPKSIVEYNGAQAINPGTVSLPLVLQVTDAAGLPVAGAAVRWTPPLSVTLQRAMTTTNVQGIATATAIAPRTIGSYVISANAPNSLGVNFTLNVTTGNVGGGGVVAGGLSMVFGNGQVAVAGETAVEPLEVLATNSSGKPAAGGMVTFTSDTPGSFLQSNPQTCTAKSGTSVTCAADGNGLASVIFQGPGVLFGDPNVVSTVTASTPGGNSVPFVVTTVPQSSATGPLVPVISTLAPAAGVAAFTGQAGQTLKGAIQIKTTTLISLGATPTPVPNIGLEVRPNLSVPGDSPNVSCAGPGGTVLTDANGVASCDLVLGSQVGTYPVYGIVGGYVALSPQFAVTITAPVLVSTTLAITGGNNQSGAVGQALTTPLTAVVEDQFGNPIANTAVIWSVVQGSATLTNASAKSDANGKVSAGVTLGSSLGAVQIKVAAGSASAIFHATATVAISGITKTSGDNQSAAMGAAFASPLVVNVTVSSGSAANIPVAFAVATGSTGTATLSASSVNTDSSGNASVTVTAGSTTGAVQITASTGGKSVTFSLTVAKPGPQLTPASFLNGASFATGPMVNGAVDPGFAPGSIITIKAVGLTTGLNIPAGSCLTGTPDDGLPGTGALPTNIGGVEFQFQSTLAPIFAICRNADGTEQANLQAPLEMGPPSAGVLVKYAAGTPSENDFFVGGVPVLVASPGIFEYFENPATKIAVAIKADGSVISATNPAHPGDTIQVYATGLGPVLPTKMATNTPGVAGQKVYFTPTVSLGGTNVGGVTATYAENAIGIYLVQFQIPSGQTAGNISLVVGVISDQHTGNTPFSSQTSQIPIAQ
jgi:uncharacterized protein (TIGR03437 family)